MKMENDNESPLQEMQMYLETEPIDFHDFNNSTRNEYQDSDYQNLIVNRNKFISQGESTTLGNQKNLYDNHNISVYCFEKASIILYNKYIQTLNEHITNHSKFALENFQYYLVENLLGKSCLHNDRHREYIKFILNNFGNNDDDFEGITLSDRAKQLDSVL
jgi:hypothetical protein